VPKRETEGERPESRRGPCLDPRNAMTTRIDEAPPKERTHKIHAPKRGEAQTVKRAESSDLASFSEADLAPKPLVAFDVPPVPAALPQTW
jgi:hypothetical protein